MDDISRRKRKLTMLEVRPSLDLPRGSSAHVFARYLFSAQRQLSDALKRHGGIEASASWMYINIETSLDAYEHLRERYEEEPPCGLGAPEWVEALPDPVILSAPLNARHRLALTWLYQIVHARGATRGWNLSPFESAYDECTVSESLDRYRYTLPRRRSVSRMWTASTTVEVMGDGSVHYQLTIYNRKLAPQVSITIEEQGHFTGQFVRDLYKASGFTSEDKYLLEETLWSILVDPSSAICWIRDRNRIGRWARSYPGVKIELHNTTPTRIRIGGTTYLTIIRNAATETP